MVKRLVRLAEHVFRLALPYGESTVNSYLFEGTNGYTVMDTGVNDELTRREWTQLRESGLVIEKVIITHCHPDHIGLAAWFQQELNIPVICSRQCYEQMQIYHQHLLQADHDTLYAFNRKYDGPDLSEKQFYRYLGSTHIKPDQLYDNHDQVILGDEQYEAILTPGHAEDHYCFWHPASRILVSSDMMFADTAPVIPYWLGDQVNPLGDYFQSLDIIQSYAAELILPGHGHVIHDLQQRAEDIRNTHQFRMQQILGELGTESKTAGQLSRDLYGNDRGIMQELLEFYTVLARLMYLQHEGFVQTEKRGDHIYFYRP